MNKQMLAEELIASPSDAHVDRFSPIKKTFFPIGGAIKDSSILDTGIASLS